MAIKVRTPLPWRWITIAVTTILLLFLILAAYVEGELSTQFLRDFWQNGLRGPLLIAFIMALYPVLWRLYVQAVEAFRPLLTLDNGTTKRLVIEITTFDRRRECAALFAGFVFYLIIIQPWAVNTNGLLLNIYMIVSHALMFSLLGWLAYITFASVLRLSHLGRRQLKWDIFNAEAMSPIARWSLGISLAWVGGISLSLVFQSQETLILGFNIIIYAVLVLVAFLVFFLSMWSAHNVMAGAKKKELAIVRNNLVEASHEFKNILVKGPRNGMESLSSTIATLETYRRLVQEIPEWPFNANILRRLMASILVPAIVYIIKIFSSLGVRFGA